MAEQPSEAPKTSVGTTGRALVMLLCLVALPLLALRGTTVRELARRAPEVINKLLDRRAPSNSVKESQPEAPRFQPGQREAPQPERNVPPAFAGDGKGVDAARQDDPAASEPMPRRLARSSSNDASENDGSVASTKQLKPSFTAKVREAPNEETFADPSQRRRGGMAASGADSLSSDSLAPPVNRERPEFDGPRTRSDVRSPATETADVRRTSLVPVTRRERNWANTSHTDSPPLQNAVIRPEANLNQTAADPPDRFTYVADRLRELGAVYYLLETWGSERFRFHCKMAVGGNPNYTRHFEATDRDPMQAMGKVLSDVETWRSSR